MKAVCTLAAQCAKCGELFDYSYDMKEKEEEKASRENLRESTKTGKNGLLCWDCRHDN